MAEATNITNIPLKINNVNIIQNQNELTKEIEKQVQPAPQKTGFFMGMRNKVKSWWVVEEEEYIDAHGFKAKRPKRKIPLRDQKIAQKKEFQYIGGEGLAYASQHTPFGRMFL